MELTGAEKYQPEVLEKLEKSLDEQVAKNTFSLESNLALLRFYQFQPQSIKINVLGKVLLKALMQLPKPDYKNCIHLIPERLQSDETISKIVQLANALETTRFTDFWALAGNCKELLSSIPGFHEAVREYVLHVLTITSYRVPKAVLGEYLKLEGAELDKLVKDKVASAGWSVQPSPAGELVALPRNEMNQVVVKRTQEVIRLEQVSPVLRAVTVGFT
mmetsp:Transcript_27470/g.60086  ORF Transcript_27470/g.60086 Transcript_27470/m.60086 type:complete len:218 (+) Transcript_27470:121-774(+)